MDTYKLLQERLLKINLGIATLMFFMPAFLWWIEGERYRSISSYAESPHPWILPIFLVISSIPYIMEGTARRDEWWQYFLGASLIGIAFTPVNHYPYIHYVFTSLFFFGSSAFLIIYSNGSQKTRNIIYAAIMSLGIILSFIFQLFPVFYGEWIAFIPMIQVRWQNNMKFYKTL